MVKNHGKDGGHDWDRTSDSCHVKVRNLEMLGKHVTVNAFKEQHEYTGPKGGPIQTITTQMTPQEAAEIYADTLHDE